MASFLPVIISRGRSKESRSVFISRILLPPFFFLDGLSVCRLGKLFFGYFSGNIENISRQISVASFLFISSRERDNLNCSHLSFEINNALRFLLFADLHCRKRTHASNNLSKIFIVFYDVYFYRSKFYSSSEFPF